MTASDIMISTSRLLEEIIMSAQFLLVVILLVTIIPVSLLFGIPASKYNKKVQKEENEERQ